MKKLILAYVLCGFAFLSQAQNQQSNANTAGNPKLPSSNEDLQKIIHLESENHPYSVEDYFRSSKKYSFKFSPNGKYISYRKRNKNGKNSIYIKKLRTGKTKELVRENKRLISDYFWGNNQTVLFLMDHGGDENYHLYAINIDGSGRSNLTPFKGVTINKIYTIPKHHDFIIVCLNKENKQIFEPYKISLKDGEITRLYKNKNVKSPADNYIFDKDGHLRGYTKQIDGGRKTALYYRTSKKAPFKKTVSTNWKNDFQFLSFNYQSKNPDDAYVLTNLYNDKDEIILYDFKRKKVLKKIYENDKFDVTDLQLSKKRNYEIDYFTYYGEKRHIVPVSETFKKLYNTFKTKFKGYDFSIKSKTDKENRYLILVKSDRLYGKYYLYNKKKNTFKMLFNLRPKLKEKDMARVRPIKFKSRDGLTLYGYLTIPKEAEQRKKVPLIVNPHGGPYGIRDHWGFNPEAQLFANFGYATLQVNYRGSGGYGKTFYLAGSHQIGRKMLDDLEDGVNYVKTLNLINPKKIAIYGGSYGGLATLGSLVKTPKMYCCGVDYCGISNLFTFFKAFPPYWKPYLGQVYEQWYNENKPEDRIIIKQISPALNADKIIRPLLVAQGANDPRVNIKESDQIVENLRKKGFKVPYIVKDNEGHGFRHEKNKIELYKVMIGFFAKYLKS